MSLFPFRCYKISGTSMEPHFHANERVLICTWSIIRPGDIVVCRAEAKTLLKKVDHKEGNRFFVIGENRTASTDSHDFGCIDRSAILGKVLFKY